MHYAGFRLWSGIPRKAVLFGLIRLDGERAGFLTMAQRFNPADYVSSEDILRMLYEFRAIYQAQINEKGCSDLKTKTILFHNFDIAYKSQSIRFQQLI